MWTFPLKFEAGEGARRSGRLFKAIINFKYSVHGGGVMILGGSRGTIIQGWAIMCIRRSVK